MTSKFTECIKHRYYFSVESDLYVSPCAAAYKASMDCLNRNDYDRDACLKYFQAYRDCKDIWVSVCCHMGCIRKRDLSEIQIKQRKQDRRAGRA